MISSIVSMVKENPVVKRVPSVGPVIGGVGLALDVKDIVENATPIWAAKTIGARFVEQCTPPKVLLAGKCVMLVGGVVASITTGGNPVIVIGAARSIIRG